MDMPIDLDFFFATLHSTIFRYSYIFLGFICILFSKRLLWSKKPAHLALINGSPKRCRGLNFYHICENDYFQVPSSIVAIIALLEILLNWRGEKKVFPAALISMSITPEFSVFSCQPALWVAFSMDWLSVTLCLSFSYQFVEALWYSPSFFFSFFFSYIICLTLHVIFNHLKKYGQWGLAVISGS